MEVSGALSSSEDEAPIPHVEIVEQPKSRGYRFRYGCEGKTAGALPGEHSQPNKKTMPSFKVNNVPSGCSSIVVVSCVTTDDSHRPHPHKLVGKDCEKGVCTLTLKRTSTVLLQHIGIQCVKKKEIKASIDQRQQIQVNPFSAPYFEEDYQYDMKKVQLAIQGFIRDNRSGQHIPLRPVLSNVIHDLKAENDLVICRTDKTSSQAKGGEEVFLLCEKVNKDDIQVQFYDNTGWESWGDFSPADVHKQYAIVFKTPPYKDQNIQETRQVMMRLYRPTDDAYSEYKTFMYKPNDIDPFGVHSKRRRKMPKLNLPGPEPQMPVLAAFNKDSTNGKKMISIDLLQKLYNMKPGSSPSSTVTTREQTQTFPTRGTEGIHRAPEGIPRAPEGVPRASESQSRASEGLPRPPRSTSEAIVASTSGLEISTPFSQAVPSPSGLRYPKIEPQSSPLTPCLDQLTSSPSHTNTHSGTVTAPIPSFVDQFNPMKSSGHEAPVPTMLPGSQPAKVEVLSQPVMATEESDPQQLFNSMTAPTTDSGLSYITELSYPPGSIDWGDMLGGAESLLSPTDEALMTYLAENPGMLEPDSGGGGGDDNKGDDNGQSKAKPRKSSTKGRKKGSNNRKGK